MEQGRKSGRARGLFTIEQLVSERRVSETQRMIFNTRSAVRTIRQGKAKPELVYLIFKKSKDSLGTFIPMYPPVMGKAPKFNKNKSF